MDDLPSAILRYGMHPELPHQAGGDRLRVRGAGVFVSSGIQLDLTGLLHSPSALVRVPVFLLALLVVRGLPALLGLRTYGTRTTAALGLLQATSLPVIVTATMIGMALG